MTKKNLIPQMIENLKPGIEFVLNLKGSCWIKLSSQGMDNQVHYCRSSELLNTRCQRLSYRHRYIYSGTKVYTYD